MSDQDSLEIGEIHPAARSAFEYIKNQMATIEWIVLEEAIASTALSGERDSNIYLGTIKRLRNNEPVSDRYILGLAWFFKRLEEESQKER